MSQRPKHKHWTIKLLNENSGQSLHDNGFGNDLWYQKHKETEEKINYTSWNPCIQPLHTLSRDKRQLNRMRKKIWKSHISQGNKVHKEFLPTTQQQQKMDKGLY